MTLNMEPTFDHHYKILEKLEKGLLKDFRSSKLKTCFDSH
jgi:hypothetical protein